MIPVCKEVNKAACYLLSQNFKAVIGVLRASSFPFLLLSLRTLYIIFAGRIWSSLLGVRLTV